MKTGNICLLLFIAGMLLACESNEISSAKMYVKEEINNSVGLKDQFEYEGEHLILFKRFFDETLSTITEFEYQNDQLKRVESKTINGGIDYLVELEHNSEGQIIKEKITYPDVRDSTSDLIIVILSDFTYFDNGNLRTKKTSYSDSTLSYPTETEFEWNNENLVKINVTHLDLLGNKYIRSQSMTYDSKRNYSNQDWAFVYLTAAVIGSDETLLALSKNNSLSTTQTLFGQTLVGILTTFSYNKNGYPIEYKYKIGGYEYGPVQVKYE